MIHFFRHIRRQLVKSSQTSRYILYAIGEIFLVVIGILIALQINNWNEDKVIRTEIEANLLNLTQAIQKDYELLETIEANNTFRYQSLTHWLHLAGIRPEQPSSSLALSDTTFIWNRPIPSEFDQDYYDYFHVRRSWQWWHG